MSVAVKPFPAAEIAFDNGRKSELAEEEAALVLPAKYDQYDGVVMDLEKVPLMEAEAFGSVLRSSMSLWKKQSKKGVWIKLPIGKVDLAKTVVQQGFWFHHAEPSYLMLVNWIPKTPCTLPGNASHRVGVGAVVLNDQREILVVQENSGCLRGKGIWKIPTGTVDEGEDMHDAIVREVKEETGIDTEFVEVIGFRQAHKAFFDKSDMFFVCVLRPLSFDVRRQELEIKAAKWMHFDEYTSQPIAQEDGLFMSISEICREKLLNGDYKGFAPVPVKPMLCGRSNCFYRKYKLIEQYCCNRSSTE